MFMQTYTGVFIAAILMIAKTWKQPRCLLNIYTAKHTVDSPNNGIMFRNFKKSSLVKKRNIKRTFYAGY